MARATTKKRKTATPSRDTPSSAPRFSQDINEHVPRGYTLRAHQQTSLQYVADHWHEADVFVIGAPVAWGKSLGAATLAQYAWKVWGKKSVILTPNNILLNQYKESFPLFPSISRQDSYVCQKYEKEPRPLSCKASKKYQGAFCRDCTYLKALRRAKALPFSILNYHSYIAYKEYRSVVIIDEAHNLPGHIAGMAARIYWQHLIHYPSWVKDYKTLEQWLETEIARLENRQELPERVIKLKELYEELTSSRTRRVITKEVRPYHREDKECLVSTPVDIRDEPPLMWPDKKVQKLILMSATITPRDIEELGLSKRRVCYVPSISPIPKEQRPCYVLPVANLSYHAQEKSLPILVKWLEEYMENRAEKGVIHAPYALARKLERYMGSNPRLIFHQAWDRTSRFEEFKDSEGKVFVASGLYEGVSLDEDLARWQVICKIPYPSLAEPAIKYLAENDPSYYANRTIKDVVQTYGRVCRSPTDQGDTIIVDSSFNRLLSKHRELMPDWFVESIIEKDIHD